MNIKEKIYRRFNIIVMTPFRLAIWIIKRCFEIDKAIYRIYFKYDKSLYRTYKDNIAMFIYDNTNITEYNKRNQLAELLMKKLFW